MSGHYPRRLGNRSVSQAAMPLVPDVPESLHEVVLNAPVRAVVLAVYYPDEDTKSRYRAITNWAITCDVRTLGSIQVPLAKVPVYQPVAGLYDEDIIVPRAASIDIERGELTTEGSGVKPRPSGAASMDGSIIMLDFENKNPRKPFIMPFGPPHPKQVNKPISTDGRVRRIRHNGTIIEIDKDGNVTIDASAAKTDALAVDGSQVANPSGGNILIKTNASPGLLNLQEATDFLIKGTTFWVEFQKVLAELVTWSGTVTPPGTSLATKIAAFIASSSQWISTRTKTG